MTDKQRLDAINGILWPDSLMPWRKREGWYWFTRTGYICRRPSKSFRYALDKAIFERNHPDHHTRKKKRVTLNMGNKYRKPLTVCGKRYRVWLTDVKYSGTRHCTKRRGHKGFHGNSKSK
jgi:hypothetical protein